MQYHYSYGPDFPFGNKWVENLESNELSYLFKSSTTYFFVLASLVYKKSIFVYILRLEWDLKGKKIKYESSPTKGKMPYGE